jgi:tryptophan-rich sensory protein
MILLYTNLLLTFALLYFYFNAVKNYAERILALLLVSVSISSQIFWRNPIKGTTIHTIDAIIAKVCILSFIFYTILFKLQTDDLALIYAILLAFIAVAAGFSSYYSSKTWCSPSHLYSHAFLHYFCFIATFFAF